MLNVEEKGHFQGGPTEMNVAQLQLFKAKNETSSKSETIGHLVKSCLIKRNERQRREKINVHRAKSKHAWDSESGSQKIQQRQLRNDEEIEKAFTLIGNLLERCLVDCRIWDRQSKHLKS